MAEAAAISAVGAVLVKIIDVAADMYRRRRDARGEAVAVTREGDWVGLPETGQLRAPDLPAWRGYRPAGSPVAFRLELAPADDWAHEYLLAEQPVVVVVENLDPEWDLDSIVSIASLAEGLEGTLYPGTYRVTVFVFLDDDPDMWDEDDLDGWGTVDVTVRPGDSPFVLRVPIEADLGLGDEAQEATEILEDEGFVTADDDVWYEVELQAGVLYTVFLEPLGSDADLDLEIFDENDTLVAQDTDLDSEALCTIRPAWTGPFSLVVSSADEDSRYRISVEA